MSIVIYGCNIWWGLFTRVAECSKRFQEFHIKVSDFNHYKKHLHEELIRNNGMFFFAVDDDLYEPVAATAVSFGGGVLQVHFYWSSYREFKLTQSAVFSKVNEYCLVNKKDVQYVEYPVTLESFNNRARKYAEIKKDYYGRLIVWHKIEYDLFMKSVCSVPEEEID